MEAVLSLKTLKTLLVTILHQRMGIMMYVKNVVKLSVRKYQIARNKNPKTYLQYQKYESRA